MTDDEGQIEVFIRDAFEENYELLRLEGAGVLSPDAKQTALQQALLYWRKMRGVAERVTDTEVHLSLPGQRTAREREFTITGIVDIVRDSDRTVMYDIKSQTANLVRANVDLYQEQLNVYAYIWQTLRDEPLDEAAVIATEYPEGVKEALAIGDEDKLAYELERWQPLVPMPFDAQVVQGTVEKFGAVVDAIEDGDYAPRMVEELQARIAFGRTRFATRVCRNCDARFSCSSYREYALQGRGRSERAFREYFSDLGTDLDQENWRTSNLNVAPGIGDLMRDFVE